MVLPGARRWALRARDGSKELKANEPNDYGSPEDRNAK